MSDDRLAAELAAIRERNDEWIASMALTEASVNDSPFGDLRRALAAVEAALEVHQELEGRCTACTEFCTCAEDAHPDAKVPAADLHKAVYEGWANCTHGNTPWPCPTVTAITRELLGEEDGDG